MAYLPDDLKEKQEDGQDPTNPDGTPQAPGGTGGGSFAGGGGTGSTGAGNSGVAGWTNIQNYLAANTGKSGTSDLAKKEVGDTFSKEQSDFDSAKTTARNQAQAEVDRTNIGTDQASKLLEQAAQNYSYDPNARASSNPDLYGEAKGKLQTALNPQYQGPTGFSYGTGAKTQEYGQELGSDQGWSAIMNSIYDKAAGGPMGAGSRALQTQLDSNDPNVQATRQALADQYSGLQGNITSGVTDTDAFLKDAATRSQAGADEVRNYLTGEGQAARSAVDRKRDLSNDAMKRLADSVAASQNTINRSKHYDDDIFSMTPKDLATEANVAGATGERNRWNAIADALGLNEQLIGQEPEFDPTKSTYDWNTSYGGHGNVGLDTLQNDPAWKDLADPSALAYLLNQNAMLPVDRRRQI